MRRRTLLILTAALCLASPCARAGDSIPRIGYLSPGSSRLTPRDEAFRQGLRELGYVEGENIIVEYRFAEGHFDRLPGFASELVRLKVDVIVAVVTQASLAAHAATSAIPIVMVAISDPVSAGLAKSLARPGANLTGTSSMSADVVGKSLEVLKEVVPRAAKVAVLWNPANAVFQTQTLDQARRAARALGLDLKVLGVSDDAGLEAAFRSFASDRIDALLVQADPYFLVRKAKLIALVEQSRLPAIYNSTAFAAAGGLMAYGPNMAGQFRRAASYVDRILRGAKPGDLPIERPTQFDLVVNLKAAKRIGITFSLSLLGRADEVIE